MAKINPETHKLEKPGRSIYLSNSQWASLQPYLEKLLQEEGIDDEATVATLQKLLKMVKEVVSA